ncbi:hypothetical protein [Dokdonia sp.]|uniref:hypothetical protein n=1 Tax=Dokdonia sp. TaxID=2024995 RepID=UPI003264A97E
MRKIIYFMLALCFNNIEAQETKTLKSDIQSAYTVIYEADKDGNRSSGDLETLIQLVRNGNPIRVGWEMELLNPTDESTYVLEHWSDAGFISIHQGHVFAQIPSIYGQGSSAVQPELNLDPSMFLVNNKPHGWVAIVGTTGVLRQKMLRDENTISFMKDAGMTDTQIEEQLEKMETSNFKTKWAVATK